jgi:hypothetical protein
MSTACLQRRFARRGGRDCVVELRLEGEPEARLCD